jgi:hypothetical protein
MFAKRSNRSPVRSEQGCPLPARLGLAVARDVEGIPPQMLLVRTDRQSGPLLNLFCTGRNARFYMSDYKHAPWSLSRDCVKHLTVFQILTTWDQLSDSPETR